MLNEPILCPITEMKIPQSKSDKQGSLLYQELDSSHVTKQTGDRVRRPYGSGPKMNRVREKETKSE